MYKIGIIGPESTGKTSLARLLALHLHGIYIPEYAREYMESLPSDYKYTYDDVFSIAYKQVKQLEAIDYIYPRTKTVDIRDIHSPEAAPVYLFDTELIITKVWFLHKYGNCPDFLEDALHAHPMDYYVLCYPDLPWEPDPVRENPDLRQYLYDWYEREIKALGIPYEVLRHDPTSPYTPVPDTFL